MKAKIKMINFLINKPDKKDIPALLNLWQKQYKFHNDLDPIYYVPNSENQNKIFEKYIEKSLIENSPKILIAKKNNIIVGFITFDIEENNYIDTNIRKFGEIIEIFVLDEYRKKGIGVKLIQEAEHFFIAKGIKHMKISSSSFNDYAIKFYQNNGYSRRQISFFKTITKNTEDKIQFLPLSEKYLNETIELLNLVFPIQDEEENADTCLKASLYYSKYKDILKKWRISKLEYYIGIDENKKIVATSGIYEMENDPESAWLGWTSVNPYDRKRGIGKKILAKTLNIMKKRGYKYSKLHTVDIDSQKDAHRIYEKMGYKLVRRDIKAEIGHDRLFYIKEL